ELAKRADKWGYKSLQVLCFSPPQTGYLKEDLIASIDALLAHKMVTSIDFLKGCVRDAIARLILPSLEREFRREITDQCERHAVEVFARNLRHLFLQPPVAGRRVLAIDPAFKSGCKVVVVDPYGNPLEHDLLHIVGKSEKREEASAKLAALVEKHDVQVIAIGNGAAGRETENFVAELVAGPLAERGLEYVIVNEAGASVYSTSPLGREEFPQHDASIRSAISIGRRLQDPLSELVKIEPANIGVGLYQHDVRAKHLHASLDAVVESCVNYVGVDVNTASPALLRYVSGLNQAIAKGIAEWRAAKGAFENRQQLREVPGFGEATYVQAAGFLKIGGGSNPLDATWIHPESYAVAERVLERLGASVADLSGRDQTEELMGAVLNVVDFGAFVDIGLHDSGLVHISQLSRRFVRDPHDLLSVGQVVKVWVLELDKNRRRVALTMIPPGQPQQQTGRRQGERRDRPGRAADREAGGGGKRPRRGRKGGAPAGGPRGRTASVSTRGPRVPAPPITEAMREGREPLRTFGDLFQFVKQSDEPEPTPAKKKRRRRSKKKAADETATATETGVEATATGEAGAVVETGAVETVTVEPAAPQDKADASEDGAGAATPQAEETKAADTGSAATEVSDAGDESARVENTPAPAKEEAATPEEGSDT
ncbi:S1 RNA-binding domain-containing protein, partial [bacterium]|nr:S1 RNA-binding domain-containing protein [bacterium]